MRAYSIAKARQQAGEFFTHSGRPIKGHDGYRMFVKSNDHLLLGPNPRRN
jgi:hypothetical protein